MPPTDIPNTLRHRRRALGLSQAALAEKAGVTQAQLSGIERGTTNARMGTVVTVARTLGLEPVFVPSDRLPVVEAVLSDAPPDQPLYTLDEED